MNNEGLDLPRRRSIASDRKRDCCDRICFALRPSEQTCLASSARSRTRVFAAIYATCSRGDASCSTTEASQAPRLAGGDAASPIRDRCFSMSGENVRRMGDIVRDQKPVILPPSATVMEACCQMRDRRVGAVLVAEEDRKLLGIFTGRDAVCRVLAEARDPRATRLSDVMTREPRAIPPHRTAIDALRLMEDGWFRHVPVVAEGKIVGIASHGDFRGLEQA